MFSYSVIFLCHCYSSIVGLKYIRYRRWSHSTFGLRKASLSQPTSSCGDVESIRASIRQGLLFNHYNCVIYGWYFSSIILNQYMKMLYV
ncbi:hypothetical protein KFK09_026423 [Dendrobium nobile]|uniref:Uncharacterized protein n=1 Tax=Dendrobium nobile TaxID=94219 RepID=A0A8T3A6S3_DENNO|nr:hypothetical protein KFK09_026423 [Dendrobium nobile]